MKRNIKRRGFTLVELLIVIVVIGILSAMMMLSSTEAVTSAKASNIVSNLRNLKTAALAFYVDHMDMMEGATNVASTATSVTKGTGNDAKTTKFTTSTKDGSEGKTVTFIEAVAIYMNASDSTASDAKTLADQGYGVLIDDKGDWFVTYSIANSGSTSEQNSVKEKLAGRAKSVGLFSGGTTGQNATTPKKDTYFKNTDTSVAMFVR